MSTIDVNVDAGESYGRWTLGDDEALFALGLVTSVNVACGYHAGDPATMRRTVRAARQRGVAIGAHPSYPDLMGFGRRQLAASPEEIGDLVTYQLGALAGFCAAEQTVVQHVKPHGALYAHAAHVNAAGDALARAAQAIDDRLVIIAPAGPIAEELHARTGATVAHEAYVDLDLGDDGVVIVEARPRQRDPQEIAERALQAARGILTTVSGQVINTRVDTICIHGDAPNVVANVEAIRDRFAQEGIEPRPLADVLA
ncbi:MAG TPA: 5-oxoprolinase subunit PxpA [Conexibacter sp.]|jgi:UPF0271 protein